MLIYQRVVRREQLVHAHMISQHIPAMRGVHHSAKNSYAIWILGAVERIAPKFESETNMANLSFQRQILYKSGIF